MWRAGVGSRFPARSFARTRRTCLPRARPRYVFRAKHARNARASSLHWNVEPVSDERNVNRAVLEANLAGGAVRIVVFGGLKSTRHVHLAAVASNAPSLPART